MNKLVSLIAALMLTTALQQPVSLAAERNTAMLIDDFARQDHRSNLGTDWRFVADTVMGGISSGSIDRSERNGAPAMRLAGKVSLENNGGFIQAALPLAGTGRTFNAGAFRGIELSVRGNQQEYSIHLRTADQTRPWQSYRASFQAAKDWRTLKIPFAEFVPYRTDIRLDTTRLVRLGLVAIGREFTADLLIRSISLYK